MNLLLSALKTGIDEVVKERGLKDYRVSHKCNERGELVIALIVSPNEPALTPEKVKG